MAVTDCSRYCEMMSVPEQMPRLARIAIWTAVGRGGVAVLVLPGDVVAQDAAHETGSAAP